MFKLFKIGGSKAKKLKHIRKPNFNNELTYQQLWKMVYVHFKYSTVQCHPLFHQKGLLFHVDRSAMQSTDHLPASAYCNLQLSLKQNFILDQSVRKLHFQLYFQKLKVTLIGLYFANSWRLSIYLLQKQMNDEQRSIILQQMKDILSKIELDNEESQFKNKAFLIKKDVLLKTAKVYQNTGVTCEIISVSETNRNKELIKVLSSQNTPSKSKNQNFVKQTAVRDSKDKKKPTNAAQNVNHVKQPSNQRKPEKEPQPKKSSSSSSFKLQKGINQSHDTEWISNKNKYESRRSLAEDSKKRVKTEDINESFTNLRMSQSNLAQQLDLDNSSPVRQRNVKIEINQQNPTVKDFSKERPVTDRIMRKPTPYDASKHQNQSNKTTHPIRLLNSSNMLRGSQKVIKDSFVQAECYNPNKQASDVISPVKVATKMSSVILEQDMSQFDYPSSLTKHNSNQNIGNYNRNYTRIERPSLTYKNFDDELNLKERFSEQSSIEAPKDAQMSICKSEYSDMFDSDEDQNKKREIQPELEIRVEAVIENPKKEKGLRPRLDICNIELYDNGELKFMSIYDKCTFYGKILSMKKLPDNYYQIRVEQYSQKDQSKQSNDSSSLQKKSTSENQNSQTIKKVKFRGQAKPFMKYLQNCITEKK